MVRAATESEGTDRMMKMPKLMAAAGAALVALLIAGAALAQSPPNAPHTFWGIGADSVTIDGEAAPSGARITAMAGGEQVGSGNFDGGEWSVEVPGGTTGVTFMVNDIPVPGVTRDAAAGGQTAVTLAATTPAPETGTDTSDGMDELQPEGGTDELQPEGGTDELQPEDSTDELQPEDSTDELQPEGGTDEGTDDGAQPGFSGQDPSGMADEDPPMDAMDGTDDAMDGTDDAMDGTDDAMDSTDDAMDGADDAMDGADDTMDGADDTMDGADDAMTDDGTDEEPPMEGDDDTLMVGDDEDPLAVGGATGLPGTGSGGLADSSRGVSTAVYGGIAGALALIALVGGAAIRRRSRS